MDQYYDTLKLCAKALQGAIENAKYQAKYSPSPNDWMPFLRKEERDAIIALMKHGFVFP